MRKDTVETYRAESNIDKRGFSKTRRVLYMLELF
jgi:hypothetical protein